MKKFTFNKKHKIISIIFLITILIPSILWVSIALSKTNLNKENIEQDFEINEFNNINISNNFNKENLNNLLITKNSKKMSKINIEKHLGKIIKDAFSNSFEFRNENIDDYNLKIRYKLNEYENDLKINIFLYNKSIKNKKYRSSCRIYII